MPAPAPSSASDAELAELRAVQQFMATALFRPLAVGDRMQRTWIDGRPMSRVAASVIKPNDRLSAFDRLEIYNRVYWFRVLDCLYDDFPAVSAIIGRRRFHRLITAYLAANPSASYTLRDLGERFPKFIEDHPDWTAPHTALALEAARFEWAQVLAFDGEAKPPLGADALLGIDPLTFHIALQPYVSLLDLKHPIDEFILSLRQREEMRGGSSNTVAEAAERVPAPRPRRPRPEQVFVVVHRYQNFLYYKRLAPAAFAILSALQSGSTLAEACELGAERAEPGSDFVTELQHWFHDWAALGWMCAAQ